MSEREISRERKRESREKKGKEGLEEKVGEAAWGVKAWTGKMFPLFSPFDSWTLSVCYGFWLNDVISKIFGDCSSYLDEDKE